MKIQNNKLFFLNLLNTRKQLNGKNVIIDNLSKYLIEDKKIVVFLNYKTINAIDDFKVRLLFDFFNIKITKITYQYVLICFLGFFFKNSLYLKFYKNILLNNFVKILLITRSNMVYVSNCENYLHLDNYSNKYLSNNLQIIGFKQKSQFFLYEGQFFKNFQTILNSYNLTQFNYLGSLLIFFHIKNYIIFLLYLNFQKNIYFKYDNFSASIS